MTPRWFMFADCETPVRTLYRGRSAHWTGPDFPLPVVAPARVRGRGRLSRHHACMTGGCLYTVHFVPAMRFLRAFSLLLDVARTAEGASKTGAAAVTQC